MTINFKPQGVCKKESEDLINCVNQGLSLFQAWRQCVDKQAVCKKKFWPSFKRQGVCKKESTDLINCVDQCLSLFQAWRQCADKQPVCNKEATDLINCVAQSPYDQDQCPSLFQAWRQCVDKKVKSQDKKADSRPLDKQARYNAHSLVPNSYAKGNSGNSGW